MGAIFGSGVRGDPNVQRDSNLAYAAAHQELLRLAGPEVAPTPGLFTSVESLLRTCADARIAGPHFEVEEAAITELRGLVQVLARYNRDPSRANAERVLSAFDAYAKPGLFETNSVADTVNLLGAKLAALHDGVSWSPRAGRPGYEPGFRPEVEDFIDKHMRQGPSRPSYYPLTPAGAHGVKTRPG